MTEQFFPESQLPIRTTVDLLPGVFKTETNSKFMSAVVDPLVQPGLLQKTVGYVGKRYGKTYNGSDLYLDSDNTLRSRYQLEPGVVLTDGEKVENFHDYIDLKNQLKFFGNTIERDDLVMSQDHYSWNPPINWDKFINYREYFWEPDGPLSVPINGRGATVISEYNVTAGESSFIFAPASQVIDIQNNPTLTLYRGQTYKFNISTVNDSFIIRTEYDTGSMLYNPTIAYEQGQLAVYENQLIRAKLRIVTSSTRTTPDLISDWEFVRYVYQSTMPDYISGKAYSVGDTVLYSNAMWEAIVDMPDSVMSIPGTDSADWRFVGYVIKAPTLEYNTGVVNNGASSGTVTFEVPYDAPDVLFYQSLLDPNKFGKLIIESISDNTVLDVDSEIVGLKNYTSSNGVVFTNGLVVEFRGSVKPAAYSKDTWLVSGVGSSISLLKFSDLVTPKVSSDVPEVLFDNEGFDTQPFDNAAAYPNIQDYITIASSSIDSNSWSRYNRWFHRSVLEYSFALRGQEYSAPEEYRAKRPIIEFNANLKLYNHGSVAKRPVDFVDVSTRDVFSTIEGSAGYQIDNQVLFNGARILITADTDNLVNNKIYEVQLLTFNHNTQQVTETTSTIIPQIHLVEVDDSLPYIDECVLVKHGKKYGGSMFHFNGTNWVLSQEKTKVNQAPLFDVYDENQISFSDAEYYPVSTFNGSKILSYRLGNGRVDSQLGFSLSYLNIGNIGDIQFDWNFGTDQFTYDINRTIFTKRIETGYYKITNKGNEYDNGWVKTNDRYIQPIIDSHVISIPTNDVTFTSVDFSSVPVSDMIIRLFINGKRYNGDYLREGDLFTFPMTLPVGDVVSIKIISNIDPKTGYYEMPVGLEKNPLNEALSTFTLGQADDHVNTAIDFFDGFNGSVPGVSNLRDLDGYQPFATRFLKHSGIAPLAMFLLCDKDLNIIKSLQYAMKMYAEFKNNFVEKATHISSMNMIDAVDEIITKLASTKTVDSPFAYSDMIGSGAFTPITYTVEDIGIKTFSLSKKFSLNQLSNSAVYVYVHRIGHKGLYSTTHLRNSVDYQFNDVFGYVTLLVDLVEGDIVEIREYLSTAINYIPETPTTMGLYKKFMPMKFLDDTYVIPRMVIQGHDGSITLAYDDYRDDLLLELEMRIYNNIKQEYNPDIFDIDQVLGGYYNTGYYTKAELDQTLQTEFYKWNAQNQMNFTQNSWFDTADTFTYNYNHMTDQLLTSELPGYWRGIYNWFYDTDRPHRCPWEMLGFSEMPNWWESEYGPAPYTSDNLLLWEDLRDGLIRQGTRAGQHKRYSRPTLLDHIPVDSSGSLLSPLNSRLAHEFNAHALRDNFKFGDISPVEYAWRSSSEWSFMISIALCLLKPFEYISDKLDVSHTRINLIGQKVNNNSSVFAKLTDFVLPTSENLVSGLITYLVNHVKSKGVDPVIIDTKIKNLDVKLATRLSGFVVSDQQKYVLDSKTGDTGGVFIPPENYNIIFNVSSPIRTLTYSGVIITKADTGWVVSGYNSNYQYFNYYEALASSKDPYLTINPQNVDQLISVGGVSASYTDWEPNVVYANGQIVRYDQHFYRALKTNTSTTFNDEHNYWKLLSNLPITGEVIARNRKSFNKFTTKTMLYGTVLGSIQEVVDFLLGYEAYLKSIGFVFDWYDSTSKMVINWTTSCKEFMFWTKHNWAIGSLITLSPASSRIEVNMNGGVVENLKDGFYDYEILKSDGSAYPIDQLNVTRTFQNIVIIPDSTTDGIYYLNMYCVLKENVTIFSDRTVFNDVIYDKPTGYRQNRIKSIGYRTVDWDGDYTSPGFLYDNVNINAWQYYTGYKLGDIVAYRSNNWTCIKHHTSTSVFDNSMWSKLDSTPTKQLVSNFDYKINQFDEFYDTTSEGIGETQRMLARHAIGYQTREYLQDLAEDPVTQFQLYQGFIREKGTINSINKVFDKLSRSGDSSIQLNEEWAFRVGQFGGVDSVTEIEFELERAEIKLNPQPIVISANGISSDYAYQIDKSKFTLASVDVYSGINKVSYDTEPTRTAGYVKTDQVAYTVKEFDDIINLDITKMNDNDNIWVTFYQYTWNVYRFNDTNLRVIDIIDSDTTIDFVLSSRHNFAIGDIFGVRPYKSINEFSGLFKVVGVTWNTVSIEHADAPTLPLLNINKPIYACTIKPARFKSYAEVQSDYAAGLTDGSRLWVDKNDNNQWEVIQKKNQYNLQTPINYGTNSLIGAGYSVVCAEKLNHSITSVPGSNLITVHQYDNANLVYSQLIMLPISLLPYLNGSFGYSLAVSPDNRFLVVGSPLASNVPSKYRGEYDPSSIYIIGETVLYNGKLWELTFDRLAYDYQSDSTEIIGDGSTSTIESGMWTPATNNTVASPEIYNSDYVNQGMVSIYEYSENDWRYVTSFVSMNLDRTSEFGTSVAIGNTPDGGYSLAISAKIESDDSTLSNKHGIVYTYRYLNSEWVISNYHTSPESYQYSDSYGKSISMSANGMILAVGAPSAIKVNSNGDESDNHSGAVYVYNVEDSTIIDSIDNIPYDNFGYAVALDSTGSTLVVTSPNADGAVIDQGKAYIFRNTGIKFELSQVIESYENITNEQFGSSVAINGTKLIIGAKNTNYVTYDSFDCTFDGERTKFYGTHGYAGAVYVFEYKGEQYKLTTELKPVLKPYESFGFSIACTGNKIFVGSPSYTLDDSASPTGIMRMFVETSTTGAWNVIANQEPVVDTENVKSISLYDNTNNVKLQDVDYVDCSKLKILNIADQEITYKTLYDPAVYTIGTNDEIQIIEPSQSWADNFVGMLWWDISKAKWVHAEQGDIAYRTGHWNTEVFGSSIDVYEWVKTTILPSEWSILADTNEGLASGISGQPMYPDDNVMSVKELYHPITGVITDTYYYYWVKNNAIVPDNVVGRRISAFAVASAIRNPVGTGSAFVGLCGKESILAYNFASVISTETALLNLVYFKQAANQIPIHNEYQLLSDGTPITDISNQLEAKWIDSLVGRDIAGNRVPDDKLPTKLKYGIGFRPRQSMFIDRLAILKMVITNTNKLLATKPFTSNLDFANLNLVDNVPTNSSNLYDTVVDSDIDLQTIKVTRFVQAALSLELTNGKITEVNVINQGYGYKPTTPISGSISVPKYNYQGIGYKGPLVDITGDGTGALIEVIIDINGRVLMANIINSGKKYTVANAIVRPYSVLVNSDSTVNGHWSIYAWDYHGKRFNRSMSQAYDTTKYWSYIDWWETGYSLASNISYEVQTINSIMTITPDIGQLVRIKEFETGGWAIFICTKIPSTIGIFSDYYTMVGRESGTIHLSSKLYDTAQLGNGYDSATSFDSNTYDMDCSLELRIILRAIKDNVCIGESLQEWGNLFFTCVRAVFAEQMYVDWAFKTSFLTAIHNIGPFKQPVNYKNDNLHSFESYIDEVKPYRSTIREYISRYDTVENAPTVVSDFDLPVNFTDGILKPVTSKNGYLINQYPWKWWVDNHSYSLVKIVVHDGGEGYIEPPEVIITGTGVNASARAYVSNGSVTAIVVVDKGYGFFSAPVVELAGGNSPGFRKATAIAIIGESKARLVSISMKFDRISKTGLYTDYTNNETFVASGFTSVFNLMYAPINDKSKINVTINGKLLLNNDYSIELLLTEGNTDKPIKGTLILSNNPVAGDVINISYEKHNSLLDSVNRIDKYYEPMHGMKGKQLSQLITGVDFGGVQVQGTTFDMSGGWDTQPWFTDNWDSVESNNDYYHVCDGSYNPEVTSTVTLPYIPEKGVYVNIYLKRESWASIKQYGLKSSAYTLFDGSIPKIIRLDDIAYTNNLDSASVTNPFAQLPTFIGDGVSATIDVGSYFETMKDDVLIFRLEDSDGSLSINDPNIIDTNITGGSLERLNNAYTTATGLTAAEIIIEGGEFISPSNVSATEENVPGQVLDSVSIKVFDTIFTGTTPLHSTVAYGDGVTAVYNVGISIIELSSVIVMIDKVKKIIDVDYTIDMVHNTVKLLSPATVGSVIEIIAIGVGGVSLLDSKEFKADGKTGKYTTNAKFKDTTYVYVTVNGVYTPVGFGSTTAKRSTGKTSVTINPTPMVGDIVKVVCFGGMSETSFDSPISKINQHTFVYNDSNEFSLQMFSVEPTTYQYTPILIDVNGKLLTGVVTTYKVYDGINNTFKIEQTGGYPTPNNIRVYVNDVLKYFLIDYSFNEKLTTVSVDGLTAGDVVIIENSSSSDYQIRGNTLTVNADLLNPSDSINVVWFSQYQAMKLVSDEHVGGKSNYVLDIKPINTSYVWVYVNGMKLTPIADFYLSDDHSRIYVNTSTLHTDVVKVVVFGAKTCTTKAYEISKDMLNVYQYNRYSAKDVKLAVDLNYYDTEITVNDASSLTIPNSAINKPGAILLNGERIEYFAITGNVLSKLRRGCYGTAIAEIHPVDSYAVNVSYTERVPYNETEYKETIQFVFDGSTLEVPVSFTPIKSSRTNWEAGHFPSNYGPCDQIEVFFKGRRLRKNPMMVYNELNGSVSPAADVLLDAEFAVDGVSKSILLSTAVTESMLINSEARIDIYRKVGKVWYQQSSTTASLGITLLDNDTPMARFISEKTTIESG